MQNQCKQIEGNSALLHSYSKWKLKTKHLLSHPLYPTLLPLIFSVKNCFRVSSRGRSKAHPYCLQANDSFSKQQWISCLRQAIVQSRDRTAHTSQSQLSLHPDPALYHIAELSLSSDTEMADHTSRWLRETEHQEAFGVSEHLYSDFVEIKMWSFSQRLWWLNLQYGWLSVFVFVDGTVWLWWRMLHGSNSINECERWICFHVCVISFFFK